MQSHPKLSHSFMLQGSNQSQSLNKLSDLDKICAHEAQGLLMPNQSFRMFKNNRAVRQNQNQFVKNNFSELLTLQLLQLESKWIAKQCQIKEYVQGLKKTIEQKDFKIEKLQLDNSKLSSKIDQIENQKNLILNKLTLIHQQMTLYQTKKPINSSQLKSGPTKSTNLRFNCQNQLVNQTYKPLKQKDTMKNDQKIHSGFKEASVNTNQNKEKDQPGLKNIEERIISNLIKMFQQNFSIHPPTQSEYSIEKDDPQIFAKRGRQIRATTATNDTCLSKLQGSLIKKRQNEPQGFISQQQSNSCLKVQDGKKKTASYKSAKTITFSKDEDKESQFGIDKDRFYSHNEIRPNQKSYQQIQMSQLNQPKIQTKNQMIKHSQIEKSKCSQKSMSRFIQLNNHFNSLSDANGHNKGQKQQMNFRHSNQENDDMINKIETDVIQRQGKKRRRSKKKSTNLDYSLSDSLVSGSQVDFRDLDTIEEYSLTPLTLEKVQNKNIQCEISNFLSPQTHQNVEKVENASEKCNANFQTQNSDNLKLSQAVKQYVYHGQQKVNQNIKRTKLDIHQVQEKVQISNPEHSSSPENSNLAQVNAFEFSHLHKTKTSKENMIYAHQESSSKKKFTIQRQNSIVFQNTEQKNPHFQSNQVLYYETGQKSPVFQQDLHIMTQKARLFVQEGAPQTKCTSFQQKSVGNSFYINKSSFSDDPFKRLKMQTQTKQNQLNNKNSKILFENQILKSYNNVLEKQTKKMSKTEQLMQKFQSQNVSIMNKINKKSIY